MNRIDLILILAVLGVAGFILYKSGIFKLTSSVADVSKSASQLAETVAEKAEYIIGSTVDLPQNIAKLAEMIPDTQKAINWQINKILPDWIPDLPTWDIAKPTERAQNIVNSLRAMYPDLPNDQERVKSSVRDGITYDSKGYPIYP